MCYPFVRKALFQFDPERAHESTFQQLRRITRALFEALVRQRVPAKPISCTGLTFKSPFGLVVGFNKDGKCINTLGTMGFESIEIGVVTPHSQPGSDEPRLFRLAGVEGLINRMGFDNLGIDNPVKNIKKIHYNGVLGINIGKNKDMPVEQGKDDYLICIERIYAYTGHIAINISLPNTLGLHTLQYDEALDDLLATIRNEQNDLWAMHHKYVPIAVKIAPDLPEGELIRVADSLVRHNIDGAIATNTMLDHSLVQEMKSYDQTGDLSGRPLQLKNVGIICRSSLELDGHLPAIDVGSIGSVIVAHEEIAVGASLVQTYFDFISKGPPLVKEIVTHI